MNLPTKTLAAALVAGSVSSLAGSAGAVPLSASLGLREASTPAVQQVQWRRGWGWGGFGVGLAAGALIGGAIAATRPYYGYGYGYPGYYGYNYAPAYYGYGYPGYYGYSAGYYAPAYGYSYAYPRYRSRVYVRSYRRWSRW
jgi:hypothetical protein